MENQNLNNIKLQEAQKTLRLSTAYKQLFLVLQSRGIVGLPQGSHLTHDSFLSLGLIPHFINNPNFTLRAQRVDNYNFNYNFLFWSFDSLYLLQVIKCVSMSTQQIFIGANGYCSIT